MPEEFKNEVNSLLNQLRDDAEWANGGNMLPHEFDDPEDFPKKPYPENYQDFTNDVYQAAREIAKKHGYLK